MWTKIVDTISKHMVRKRTIWLKDFAHFQNIETAQTNDAEKMSFSTLALALLVRRIQNRKRLVRKTLKKLGKNIYMKHWKTKITLARLERMLKA